MKTNKLYNVSSKWKEGGKAGSCSQIKWQDSIQKYIALLQNYFIYGIPVNAHYFENHHKLEL